MILFFASWEIVIPSFTQSRRAVPKSVLRLRKGITRGGPTELEGAEEGEKEKGSMGLAGRLLCEIVLRLAWA